MLLVSLALVSGCSSTVEEDESEEAIAVQDANAALEIVPMDIWAQTLPQADLKLTVTRDGKKVQASEYPVAKVFLRDPGHYAIRLEAPMHEAANVELDYDGSGQASGLKLATSPRGTGVSLGHGARTFGSRSLTAHGLFVGLRHTWFSAQGRPARRGNAVQLMMDGQESWTAVKKQLTQSKSSVHVSTWWWESGFELTRDLNPFLKAEERLPNTILSTLEASPATKRVIVGQFWGQDSVLAWLNTDSDLRRHANAANDKFEFMGQANETKGSFDWAVPTFEFGARVRAHRPEAKNQKFDPEQAIASRVPGHHVDLSAGMPFLQNFADGLLETASYHQKFMTVDSKVAFVGGMNMRQNDWDTSQHAAYDPRRMSFSASANARLDVAGKGRAPDDAPRKDYMVRIEGPSAQDVDDVFRRRWEFLRKGGVDYSENTSSFEVKRDVPESGTTQLQVTATLPAPFNEFAIAETWFNAVRNAQKYIYVEDQYFRVPMLQEAIVKRMQEVPELKLVVITMGVPRTDPGCSNSRAAYFTFRKQFPTRSFFFHLRTFDGHGDASSAFVTIDTHSKMLIVDDTFVSVGSCNKNNRGLVYEGELNVAVADAAFVTEARKRIVRNLVGDFGPSANVSQDWIAALVQNASVNDLAYSTWTARPASAPSLEVSGFVHTLAYARPDDCVLASIGPDRT